MQAVLWPRTLWICSLLVSTTAAQEAIGRLPEKPALTFPGYSSDPSSVEVPLAEWVAAGETRALIFGESNGISFGDYDGDGWIDVFLGQSAVLWRNVDGTDWQLVADFDKAPLNLLPPTQQRYGASFGDYNNDGFADIAVEPRTWITGSTCFQLLHNVGDGSFLQVAGSAVISSPCGLPSETACWGDVDGDGDLDLVLPTYPQWRFPPGPGNIFWENQGPIGPLGGYRFLNRTPSSGLGNPSGTARPEGAQLCDVDFDGDLDFYANGTLYQNVTVAGGPVTFLPFDEATSGIAFSDELEEGAMFFDYDLDGDLDLFIVYNNLGTIIWESLGDGSYFAAEQTIVQSPMLGVALGMSAEDWDNDGDIDFTTRQVFRRNQLVETGQRSFTVATHNIDPTHIDRATPAWGDWDLDGDLDCAMGNWLERGRFYENTLNDQLSEEDKRYVRVRPVRDSATVALGTETEFGALVELRIAGESGVRRKKFTASSHGYLNQNEYGLHFGLPPDPVPGDPTEDLTFDVVVDFPGSAGAGPVRVDRFVNPALGNVQLARLTNREIRVFRSGKVVINDFEIVSTPAEATQLHTTNGSLIQPAPGAPLAMPSPAATPNRWVGIEFDTLNATRPHRVVEVILDGQLDNQLGFANVLLWDVTSEEMPFRVLGANLSETTSVRNSRSHLPAQMILNPGRRYRLVANVTSHRATPVSAPLSQGELGVLGGLNYQDDTPLSPAAVATATVDPSAIYLALRTRPARVGEWSDLGGSVAGAGGAPVLTPGGGLGPGQTLTMDVTGAAPNVGAILVLSDWARCVGFARGAIIPHTQVVVPNLMTDANGELSFSLNSAEELPSGQPLIFQCVVFDPTAPGQLALSNAVWTTTP